MAKQSTADGQEIQQQPNENGQPFMNTHFKVIYK
jgi:hypothetical protein